MHSKKARLAVVLAILSVPFLLVGVVAGVMPNGVEPDGLFVDCGPAVFGRRAVVDPACVEAFVVPAALCLVLVAISAVLLATAPGAVGSGPQAGGLGTPSPSSPEPC